jgi:hypothetical protein
LCPLCDLFSNVFARILGANGERDSAARGKLCRHDRFARRTGFHEIVENAVCDGFIECALVTIGGEIEFQSLALDAETVRHVIDIDPGEIGLTCDRTNGSEIVRFKVNPVIALRSGVWKNLESRLGG